MAESKPRPKSRSVDDLVEFFDNHDMGDLMDDMKEVDMEVERGIVLENPPTLPAQGKPKRGLGGRAKRATAARAGGAGENENAPLNVNASMSQAGGQQVVRGDGASCPLVTLQDAADRLRSCILWQPTW